MPHFPKPWFRKNRGWYVTLDGRQVPLGPDQDEAFRTYPHLMAEAPKATPAPVTDDSILVRMLFDHFQEWVKKHLALDSDRWYRDRLQAFLDFKTEEFTDWHPAVAQLKPFHVQEWIDAMPHKSGTKRNDDALPLAIPKMETAACFRHRRRPAVWSSTRSTTLAPSQSKTTASPVRTAMLLTVPSNQSRYWLRSGLTDWYGFHFTAGVFDIQPSKRPPTSYQS